MRGVDGQKYTITSSDYRFRLTYCRPVIDFDAGSENFCHAWNTSCSSAACKSQRNHCMVYDVLGPVFDTRCVQQLEHVVVFSLKIRKTVLIVKRLLGSNLNHPRSRFGFYASRNMLKVRHRRSFVRPPVGFPSCVDWDETWRQTELNLCEIFWELIHTTEWSERTPFEYVFILKSSKI